MTDTPQYQQVMEMIANVIAKEEASPGTVEAGLIRDLAIFSKTVMPNLTAADIVNIGQKKHDALALLANAAEANLNTLEQSLRTNFIGMSDDLSEALTNLSNSSGSALNDIYAAHAQALVDFRLTAIDDLEAKKTAALLALDMPPPRAPCGGVIIADYARYNVYGSDAYTSEMPETYLAANMQRLFEILLKNKDPDNDNVIRHDHIPRTLLPVSPEAYAVGIVNQYTKYAASGNVYNYPTFNIATMFVRNDTDADITRTLFFQYSSYWGSGYEGAQLFTVTPNKTDDLRGDTTDATYAQIWSITSSGAAETSVSVTIPANTTIAIVLACSDHYVTNSSGYQFYKQIAFKDLPTFLDGDLLIDPDVTMAAFEKTMANDFDPWIKAG